MAGGEIASFLAWIRLVAAVGNAEKNPTTVDTAKTANTAWLIRVDFAEFILAPDIPANAIRAKTYFSLSFWCAI